MPVSEPSAPSIIPADQSSAGSFKDYANRIRFTLGQSSDPALWDNVAKALFSAATQIDYIYKVLRTALPIGDLIQIKDPQGNLVAQIGDMAGVDKKAYSGIWEMTLYLGGKGPGDPAGATLTVSGGKIVSSGDLQVSGNLNLVGGVYEVNGTQVLGARRTGWLAPTGAVSRGSFDPSTVTLPVLAQHLAALLNDLTAQGIIGL